MPSGHGRCSPSGRRRGPTTAGGWRRSPSTASRCTAAKGLRLTPDGSADELGPFDVVLHPGGIGTRRLLADPAHLERVRRWAEAAELTTSVCTGSLVYAAAGLLRDRPATTYWGALGPLGELDPTIDVRPDDRFVDDGDIITSSGVSAGIDMALHLVVTAGR